MNWQQWKPRKTCKTPVHKVDMFGYKKDSINIGSYKITGCSYNHSITNRQLEQSHTNTSPSSGYIQTQERSVGGKIHKNWQQQPLADVKSLPKGQLSVLRKVSQHLLFKLAAQNANYRGKVFLLWMKWKALIQLLGSAKTGCDHS